MLYLTDGIGISMHSPALALLQRAIKKSKRGHLCCSQGNLDLALEYYRQALVIVEEQHADIHDMVASILFDQGDFDGALAKKHKALTI